MFSLKCLLDVSCYAVLTDNSGIPAGGRSLKGRVLALWPVLFITVRRFLPLPNRREVSLALRALKRLWWRRYSRLFCNEVHHVLQSDQVYEFWIRGTWHEVHLWRRWLGRWDLQQRLLQLLPQCLFGCGLTLRRSLGILARSLLQGFLFKETERGSIIMVLLWQALRISDFY